MERRRWLGCRAKGELRREELEGHRCHHRRSWQVVPGEEEEEAEGEIRRTQEGPAGPEEHLMKREEREELGEHLMRPGVRVAAEEGPEDYQMTREEPVVVVEEEREEIRKKLEVPGEEEAVVAAQDLRSLWGRPWC